MSFSISKVTFQKDRAIVILNFTTLNDDDKTLFCKRVLKKLPDIGNHNCKNNFGPTLKDCIFATSEAHIFEHILLEMLHKSKRNKQIAKFCASTRTVDKKIAKIESNYYDDIEFLKALKSSLELANACLREPLQEVEN